jgi:hypothetical protein
MKAFLLQLSLTVLAIASPVALADKDEQCCKASEICCEDTVGDLGCFTGDSCEALGVGTESYGGGCRPATTPGPGGFNGAWCSEDPYPDADKIFSCGVGEDEDWCGSPECCINGKCADLHTCEDALQDVLNNFNLVKWATIAIASCCVLGCIFFIIKKKMVIRWLFGESILEVKDTTGFHNLEDNGYTAPSNM